MSNELIPSASALSTITERPWWLDDEQLGLIQRAGTLFSASSLVPKDYQGKAGLSNCVIALNMAARIGADPLMVMQNLYVVHGRPSWSAQFLIACLNQTGRFTPLRYRWQGTEGKDDWGCRAYCTDKEQGIEVVGPLITIATAKKEGWYGKNGSKWQTIPELMLMYRAAAWLVRTHAPEIAMGLPTAEESLDIAGHLDGNGHKPVNRVTAIIDALGDPAEVPAGEAEAASEHNARNALHESLERRIQEMDTPADSIDIGAEIDDASRGNLLPAKVIKELQKALNARCDELNATVEA